MRQSGIGHALHQAQCGDQSASAKALKGFGGRGVFEVVEDFDGDPCRAVYTVRFAGLIYVLHAVRKKSKKGIATPKRIQLLRRRDLFAHETLAVVMWAERLNAIGREHDSVCRSCRTAR